MPESEREKMTQYVLENIDIMTEKIQNIEVSLQIN